MDTLTHGFVPYAAFTVAQRPRVERIAAAIGGIAPDTDALWAWTSHAHDHAYPLVHRGFSHTVWGAPLLAMFLLFVLSHRLIAARFRRFENIWFTRGALVPLWIGAWSHLLLDGLTITGIPLLWPFFDGRFTTDWFFFGIPYLLPLSLFGWIMIFRGKASDRFVTRTFAALVVILVLAGSTRVYSYPRDLVGDEDVTPGPVEWKWFVSRPGDEGVVVYATSWGRAGTLETLRGALWADSTEGLDEARRRCEAHSGYIPWAWSLWGQPVLSATQYRYVDENPDPTAGRFPRNGPFEIVNGTWQLVFYDSVKMYDALHPEPRLFGGSRRDLIDHEEGAYCTVLPSGEVDFFRPRGWIGS